MGTDWACCASSLSFLTVQSGLWSFMAFLAGWGSLACLWRAFAPSFQVKDWILFEPSTAHLQKKHEIFQSPSRDKHLIQSKGCLGPQHEVLELLLDYLPQRYPENFQVAAVPSLGSKYGPDTTITLHAADWQMEYRVGDFAHFPLELASRQSRGNCTL